MARFLTLSSLALAIAVSIATGVPGSGSQARAQEQLPWTSKSAQPQNYSPRMNAGASDAYRAPADEYDSGSQGAASSSRDDGYRPDDGGGERQQGARNDSFSEPAPRGGESGYGEPYSPPPQTYDDAQRGGSPSDDPRRTEGFEKDEVIGAGHRFFGSVSGGIASAVESIFKSQGRPNGYILGEDAGGAFIVGLRYGEGTLYTKDAGEHRVFWQGPSVGYDAGGDGSKTMVLVYNMRDPAEIYERFGGVQGAAYIVGGVSVQFQKYNDVTMAVIRSGVGLRLGANVGYLKYTRQPTWNPL